MSTGFFDGIEQKKLLIRDFESRNPVFFRSISMLGGVFSADLGAIRRILPSPILEPVTHSPGRGLIGIHCMEYKDTDIGPYNEVGFSVVLKKPRAGAGPAGTSIGALLRAEITRDYHGFVFQLPVTTEVALHGGLDFFGYPKYLASIAFHEDGGRRSCALSCPDTGMAIMKLVGPVLSAPAAGRSRSATLNSYPLAGGKLLHARFRLNQKRIATRFLGARPSIELGDHPRAAALKELRLGRCLQYVYAPDCEGILPLPEELI